MAVRLRGHRRHEALRRGLPGRRAHGIRADHRALGPEVEREHPGRTEAEARTGAELHIRLPGILRRGRGPEPSEPGLLPGCDELDHGAQRRGRFSHMGRRQGDRHHAHPHRRAHRLRGRGRALPDPDQSHLQGDDISFTIFIFISLIIND